MPVPNTLRGSPLLTRRSREGCRKPVGNVSCAPGETRTPGLLDAVKASTTGASDHGHPIAYSAGIPRCVVNALPDGHEGEFPYRQCKSVSAGAKSP
jgi:hypothetical protein